MAGDPRAVEVGAVLCEGRKGEQRRQARERGFGPSGTERGASESRFGVVLEEPTVGVAQPVLEADRRAPAERGQALQAVAEQDWVRLTQSRFAPVGITPTFWIVPSWHEPPRAARQVIRLDPGRAFGTGTHPTTRMCLRWLARRPEQLRGARLLDYGCGSGILAIGADRLVPGLPDTAADLYGIVLANILAMPLKLLAPLLCAHVAPGGQLVLAGILERQADELVAACAAWLALEVTDADEGWILMTAQRPARFT